MVGGLKISLAIGFLVLAHDPEKCAAVFRKDHAQTKSQSATIYRRALGNAPL
jgi:hypothetical protein